MELLYAEEPFLSECTNAERGCDEQARRSQLLNTCLSSWLFRFLVFGGRDSVRRLLACPLRLEISKEAMLKLRIFTGSSLKIRLLKDIQDSHCRGILTAHPFDQSFP